ncbi:MAG: stage II sporulation protein D [Bacilli bacterium]|nr:stage II sporulation protein D [Bacilli bacterium]
MKKLIVVALLVIIIPFLCTKIFIKTDNIKFKYISNNFVRVKDEKTGNISAIPFEDYIKGVVASEMPSSFEIEALKAQAVASRSYAMYQINGSKNREYDLTNTTANQVYKNDNELKQIWKEEYPKKINKIKKAIEQTSGEYLTYNSTVINAMFFSTSTGVTENSEEIFSSALPYLRSTSSKWDESSPSYIDTYKFSINDFYNKLSLPINNKLEITEVEKTTTGRTKKLKINGQEINGRQLAKKLKLRSNYFDIIQNGDSITITTKGFGHGVGMSQYGANGMAKEGYKYDEILKYYYKNTELKKI